MKDVVKLIGMFTLITISVIILADGLAYVLIQMGKITLEATL